MKLSIKVTTVKKLKIIFFVFLMTKNLQIKIPYVYLMINYKYLKENGFKNI